MTKKLFFLLLTILAVFSLVTACPTPAGGGRNSGGNGGGGGDENKKEFTVTFDRNHDDKAGWKDADPITIKVKSGENISKNEFPEPPTRSEGWGLGTVFQKWTPDKGGQMWLDPITEDITLYAQWKFVPGQPKVEEDMLVQIAPKIEQSSEPSHSPFEGEDNAEKDGSITWWNGGIRYEFPTAGLDYDYVEIEYIGIGATNTATNIPSNDMKQYGAGSYTPISINGTANTNNYPTIPTSGTLKYIVRDATGSPRGMAIRANNNTGSVSETFKRTIKFTKATFTKGDRYKITYDKNNAEAIATLPDSFGVKGLSIGETNLPYIPSTATQDFGGWYLASDTVFATEIKAATVPTTAQLTDNTLALKAKWDAKVTATTFLVDFNDSNIGLTPVGSGTTAVPFEDGTGYTFTYGSNGYPSSWAKFNITLQAGIKLSAFKEVTIQYQSAGGDTGYKPFALLAATTLPPNFSSDPHVDGSAYKINLGVNPEGNTTPADTWADLTFPIDPAKTAGLTGTIEICIYDHSAATGGEPSASTAWKIKNVIFVADTP